MALIDPKTPPRELIYKWCQGDPRLIKAVEKIFDLIPSEFNKGADDTEGSQYAADNAATQAGIANAELANVMRLAELSALSPAHAHALSDSLGISPAQELTKSDYIDVACQQIECSNFNLEIK